MKDFYQLLDEESKRISKINDLNNLKNIFDSEFLNRGNYWERLAKLGFYIKLLDEYNYDFIQEAQVLSNQIHFGIINCILFKDKIGINRGQPTVFNHRYTFMIESTIHCIYSYWNRVGLALNTYLKKPLPLKATYFNSVVPQLKKDYPSLDKNKFYHWLCEIEASLIDFGRNEFAHNNSLTMQIFLSSDANRFEKVIGISDSLVLHNKLIVNEFNNLISLFEVLENTNCK